MALVRRDNDGKIHSLWRIISPVADVVQSIRAAGEIAAFAMVVVGRGTGSRNLVKNINDAIPGASMLLVDEKDTTWQARERYWEHNPRRGWRKLLPASMQVPPVPVDDFVALILAERVLLA